MHSINMECHLSRPRLGISVLPKSKLIVAVVPRTWFGKKVPELIVNENTKIIALPDKYGRKLIIQEHSNSQTILEDLKSGFETIVSDSEKNGKVPKPKLWYKGRVQGSGTKHNFEDTDGESIAKPHDDHSMAVGLFLLMWKYNSTSENKYEFLNQMSNFSLGGKSNLLFLGQFMIENMKRYMRELRRTYKEQTVQTVAVKGRIDLMRSAPNISSGIPLLTCRVDEFNIQSPHYSALMTALDALSSLPVENGQGYLDSLMNHIKREARKLRGVFREIPSLDKSRAIRVLSNSSLPPQLRRWKQIFGYAVNILKDNSGIENPNKNVSGFTLPQIQSSVIWENILHSQIKQFNENVLPPEPAMINPWQRIDKGQLANKKPDIFFTLKKGERSLEVILDAKYYIRENEKTQELDEKKSSNSVMEHNNWQMLGYAITPLEQDQTWKENTSRIVLMGFPTLFDPDHIVYTAGQEYELTSSLILDPVETDKKRERPTPILQSLGIPFPSYKQLKDEFVNTTSLEEVDKKIAEQINTRIDKLYDKYKKKLFPVSTP